MSLNKEQDAEVLRVHAVVLNWRDAESTVRCVESLLIAKEIQQVWVVDNETQGLLRGKWAEDSRVYLLEVPENRGFSAGVNLGLAKALEARAQSILLMNNDAILDPGALEILCNGLSSNPDLGIVAPLIHDKVTGEDTYGSTLSRTGRVSENKTRNLPITFLTWACVLVRSELLRDVGTLSEEFFMYWEDVELSQRATARGWEMKVIPEARAVHATSSSHSKAGSVIAMYSTLGLGVFAAKQKWLLRLLCFMRLYARLGRALVLFRVKEFRWILRGIRLASNGYDPVYPEVLRVLELNWRTL